MSRTYHIVIGIIPRVIVTTILLCALTARDCQTQTLRPEVSVAQELLVPTRHGFIGISKIDGLTGLRRYNDSLNSGTQIYISNLSPLDAIPTAGNMAVDGALILGNSSGKPSLFNVEARDTTPEPTLLWSGALPLLHDIISIERSHSGGPPLIAMAGDSAFTVIDAGGHERVTIRGLVLDALSYHRESTFFIVAFKEESGTRLVLIHGEDGATTASFVIPWAQTIAMRIAEVDGKEQLVVVTRDAPYRAFFCDPRSLLAAEPISLPASASGLIHYGARGTAALFNTYPKPTLTPLTSFERIEHVEIDYPFHGIFEEVAAGNGITALIGRDSLALYDSLLNNIGTAPSGGIHRATLHRLNGDEILIASMGGSKTVRITPGGAAWVERNVWTIIYATVAALLSIGAIIAVRRYLFVKNIYNNLVRVPSSNGIIIMSAAQRVKHVNASARSLLGISAYIPLGRHVSEYLATEEWRPVLTALRGLFTDGTPFTLKIDVDRDGEHRSFSFRGRPMFAGSGIPAGYLLLMEDVTQTIERERLVNWASVAHHIAHEMKTPLGTVTVTAEMLYDKLTGLGADHDLLRSTSRIVRQSSRLREIVEDLLTIARTESLKKTRADMGLILSSLAHECAEYIPNTIELRLDLANENLQCHVDVSQLTVAIRNIVDNAWQAIGSRDGGSITLRAHGTDSQVTVIIEDTGIGMSRETLAKLFQPFYTEREGGSGIGTVIIKRVIEAHGGTIVVDSRIGIGTKFILNLPRT